MSDERKLFDAAEQYASHRSIPRHVKEQVREAFRMGAHWARENAAECQRCAGQYEYEVRNR